MARPTKKIEADLSVDIARAAFVPALQEHLGSLRQVLIKLSVNPPQVLLFDGGTEEERLSLARYWAALQQCEHTAENTNKQPCINCPICLTIGADINNDVLLFDGRISNKEDEENPKPIRALTKDNAVQIKSRVADATNSGKKRVIIMNGIEAKRSSAANTLLKVLEEPSPTSIFVLLAAQREQLLPTLVSRSWTLTLPWPKTHNIPAELQTFEQGLAGFLQNGKNWWPLVSNKGAVDLTKAIQVVLLCQKCLLPALAKQENSSPLSNCFARLDYKQCSMISNCLDEAQESLYYQVNPARVLELLAARMFIICNN